MDLLSVSLVFHRFVDVSPPYRSSKGPTKRRGGGGLGLEMLVYLVYFVFFNGFVGFFLVCLGFVGFSKHFLYFLRF